MLFEFCQYFLHVVTSVPEIFTPIFQIGVLAIETIATTIKVLYRAKIYSKILDNS